MKRIVSIVLTLTLLLSCVCFLASAESESYSGVYNGYNYYCYGQVTPDSLTVRMTYANSTQMIRIQGFYNYMDVDSIVRSNNFISKGKASTLATELPPNMSCFVSMTAEYYIGSTRVVYLPLSAT